MMNKLKVLAVSCGGTGGHFYPGLSVAREFNRQGGHAILLLGGKHAESQMVTAGKCGVESYKIAAVPLTHNPLKVPSFLLTDLRGMRQSMRVFRKSGAQALLCMGSFASIPPAVAARILHIPLFLHEGNARLGKFNGVFSRFSDRMALSFPLVNPEKAHCPVELTGLPLRQELLLEPLTKAQAVERINQTRGTSFRADLPLVLVFGGSLGARAVNEEFIPDPALPGLERLQLIHLSGPGRMDEVKPHYQNLPCASLVLEAASDMHVFYSASDLVISRAGGSTVSEVACFGRFAALIPFPFAAEHHQDDNARWLADAGGAVVIPDSECSPARFSALLKEFSAAPETFAAKGERSRMIAMPQAADSVLRMIDGRL